METGTVKQFVLSRDDDERMRRLTEEIQGRLEELALIAARVTGRPLRPDTVRRYARRSSSDHAYVPGSTIEIMGDGSDSTCTIYCTDPIGTMGGTVITESPCGSAGPDPCSHPFGP